MIFAAFRERSHFLIFTEDILLRQQRKSCRMATLKRLIIRLTGTHFICHGAL
ncbi:hypothetical protein HMPREF0208_04756 [Citrobacter koseri]|nr:hypothetical protein HMPREF3220_04149 [Citrobacter koseri]KXA02466.1 hypothetical protein HMPREF3207_02327 [Citrobacter koseri]KXB39353.1 hypothetical protein HMPREF0208_04756 [Citrobacter koseri]